LYLGTRKKRGGRSTRIPSVIRKKITTCVLECKEGGVRADGEREKGKKSIRNRKGGGCPHQSEGREKELDLKEEKKSKILQASAPRMLGKALPLSTGKGCFPRKGAAECCGKKRGRLDQREGTGSR